jgi:hypothetical protein
MSKVTLTIEVEVEDEAALRAFAHTQREKFWRDADAWLAGKPELGEIVFEALVLSNDNPSPLDYGIELAKYSWVEEKTKPAK